MRLRRQATTICRVLGFPDAELSISLVGDEAIADLAGRFGRDARATDVLAFSMLEGPGTAHRDACLGDVVVSLDTAARQARERGIGLDDELRDLLIHGVLHLVGMDHERSASDARHMRAMEDHLRWEIARLD